MRFQRLPQQKVEIKKDNVSWFFLELLYWKIMTKNSSSEKFLTYQIAMHCIMELFNYF